MTGQRPPTAPAAAFAVHATRRRNAGAAVASHVKSAGVEGLRSAMDVVPGMTRTLAERIKDYL